MYFNFPNTITVFCVPNFYLSFFDGGDYGDYDDGDYLDSIYQKFD
jgi:hypothetical protein